jgi:hypothetical protein
MKKRTKNSEAGVAMIMALLALMVLSAIAVGLVYMTNMETKVNSNYRSQQVAYFAAKAGMEEARDRMMLNQAGGYYFTNAVPNPLPTQVPTDSNLGILYIVNDGAQPAGTVQPWLADVNNPYMDDELCHDGYTLSGLPAVTSEPAPDIHCSTGQMPTGPAWHQSTASQLPFNGTAAAVPFKWVRIALKVNGSVQHYQVNGSKPLNTPVCWNGSSEVAMSGASCQGMTPSATPVYLLTTLAVSSTGARKMVQAEVALNPSSSFNYGLFGTGTGCGDVTFGGNGTTDSYDGSQGPYSTSNSSNTGGDVGSNGNVSINGNNAQIGGSIGVLPQPPSTTVAEGPCPGSNYTTSTPGNTGIAPGAGNGVVPLSAPVQFIAPPSPVPAPPTTPVTYTSSTSLVPGTYGSISVSGRATLTLAPGVYNINSLQLSGQSSIVITPLGQVVLNIAGTCPAPCTSPGPVLDLSGNSVNNLTLNANQFQINYGGTGSVNVTGNASTSYFVLNAPKANVTIAGNGAIFGAVLGSTIKVPGNAQFHYDKSVKLAPPSSGALQLISFRHIPY